MGISEETTSFTDLAQVLLEVIYAEARRVEALAKLVNAMPDHSTIDMEALRLRIARLGELRRLIVALTPHEPLVRAVHRRAVEIEQVLQCTATARFTRPYDGQQAHP